jgi:Protein of unknown function (DUF1553)/Protein of unknown function (DUF1549)/Planctomycete cytochrome C
MMPVFRSTLSLLVLVAVSVTSPLAVVADEIDFSRDVRPILAENCFACHGFDENAREADLRLDTHEGATLTLDGHAAVVPGKPNESGLFLRVATKDPDEIMPPTDSHKKPLDADAIATLKRWIEQGAPWGKHWSFEPPVKATIKQNDIHPIDFFVRKKLVSEQLVPASPAAAHTLVRRLSFDLTGLPPSPKQVARIVSDPTEERWNALIDELIKAPHFGERMAMWWLDGARYSDTDGFQQDGTRTNWPWRDWVVDAFNSNMPFDQFTVEQFAGDLLPNATAEQRLATCFHRNHMNNGEGGRDPEESRVDYVLDRVNTVGTLWLGLTLGCTQCHDHKFDPISQSDYYSLSAYFNSIDETGAAGGRAGPYMKYRSPYAQRAVDEATQLLSESDSQLANVKEQAATEFEMWLTKQIERTRDGFEPWAAVQPAKLTTTEGVSLHTTDDNLIVASSSELTQDDYLVTAKSTGLSRITAIKLDVYPHESHSDGKYSFSKSGEFVLTNIKLRVRRRGHSQFREPAVASAVADVEGQGEDTKYGKVSGTLDDDPRTGWTTRTKPGDVTHHAIFALIEPLVLAEDEELDIILMQRSLAPRELIGRFRLSLTDQRGGAVRSLEAMPLENLAALKRPQNADDFSSDNIDADLWKRLFDQFSEDHQPWRIAKSRNTTIRGQLNAAKKGAGDLNVMVLSQRESPRKTHVLVRGIWNNPGDSVSPNVLPAVLERDSANVPTRLEFGRWIVSRENPLTARVITNQIWQLLFGAGLVHTPSDFGMQGESPTHPELLDWLAVDFMEHGWDIKHLIRTIVTSETYRQDSSIDSKLLERDPDNRLLARGARFRLPSWMIRDRALHVSGLLNPATGGPPVFPYQPPGVWKDQFMGRFEYQPTVGPEQYRRTLYAFWRRSSAPTFLFDSAMRRTCEVGARRTNTPLHALTLLNDVTSLEAARALADDAIAEVENNIEKQVEFLCLRVLSRTPSPAEQSVYLKKHADALAFFAENRQQALAFVSIGQAAEPSAGNLPTLAATMLLANMVLNLDESMTHE